MATTNPEQKFVPRFEMAVMQYAILSKASQGEVTRENLKQTFTGNMRMTADHLDHCIRQLVQDGHLKEQNNKYVASDDGREDVQKLQHLVLELPNVIGAGGQQQRAGMTQQKAATGGAQGQTGGAAGSATGVSSGTAGNVGQGGSQQGQNRPGGR